MKQRSIAIFFLMVLITVLTACNQSFKKESSTEKETDGKISGNVTGVVQWAAGGAADTISRAIAPIAEKELGQSIIMTNKPGATGAIALKYVLDQKSDGQTVLFAAENPALYGVLGLSENGFEDLEPINIFSLAQTAIIVPKDSKYNSMEDFIKDAKANPGKVKMGSTGPGGQPFVVASMIGNVTGAEFNLVPYDGDGPLVSAILGNHLDASAVGLTAAFENAKAGKIKVLAILSDERLPNLQDVPAITEDVPEMEKFLPWGLFYGAWVKKDTPESIKKELTEAFAKAQASEEFQAFLVKTDGVSLGLTGEEAVQFWQEWQSKTAWLLDEVGETKVSPDELNIKKPE